MSAEHPQTAKWRPEGPQDRRATSTRFLLLLATVVGIGLVIAGLLLVSVLRTPVGSQHDTDEVGRDEYCAYFPEDC